MSRDFTVKHGNKIIRGTEDKDEIRLFGELSGGITPDEVDSKIEHSQQETKDYVDSKTDDIQEELDKYVPYYEKMVSYYGHAPEKWVRVAEFAAGYTYDISLTHSNGYYGVSSMTSGNITLISAVSTPFGHKSIFSSAVTDVVEFNERFRFDVDSTNDKIYLEFKGQYGTNGLDFRISRKNENASYNIYDEEVINYTTGKLVTIKLYWDNMLDIPVDSVVLDRYSNNNYLSSDTGWFFTSSDGFVISEDLVAKNSSILHATHPSNAITIYVKSDIENLSVVWGNGETPKIDIVEKLMYGDIVTIYHNVDTNELSYILNTTGREALSIEYILKRTDERYYNKEYVNRVFQEKLIAGDGIRIGNNTISSHTDSIECLRVQGVDLNDCRVHGAYCTMPHRTYAVLCWGGLRVKNIPTGASSDAICWVYNGENDAQQHFTNYGDTTNTSSPTMGNAGRHWMRKRIHSTNSWSDWYEIEGGKIYTAGDNINISETGVISAIVPDPVDISKKADLVDGKVPSSQLPSYVDDVLEYTNKTSFPNTGETGKIYVALDTNLTYRWSGSEYVEISPSLALGETSSTAYRGDKGKIAYDHSQSAHAPSNAQENVIESVKVNGTVLPVSNKSVDVSVPILTAGYGIDISNDVVNAEVDTYIHGGDDTAREILGGDWRIPTSRNIYELMNTSYCTWTWTSLGGENGYKVTSKVNGNWIFLPATGYREGTSHPTVGSNGWYWSSTITSTNIYNAHYLSFTSSSRDMGGYFRSRGYPIRPVSLTQGVDLGLPSGLRWAGSNLTVNGLAKHEYDYGDFFAWGETETKNSYSWSSYKFGTQNNLTKYNSTDGLTALELGNDVGYYTAHNDILQTRLLAGSGITIKDNVISSSIIGGVSSVAGKTGDVALDKTDVGLDNVGNFKAVSTVASQGLSSTEKSNARANIGAGTSNLAIGTTATTAAAGDHTHPEYQPLLVAGEGVKISNNVISQDTLSATRFYGSNVSLPSMWTKIATYSSAYIYTDSDLVFDCLLTNALLTGRIIIRARSQDTTSLETPSIKVIYGGAIESYFRLYYSGNKAELWLNIDRQNRFWAVKEVFNCNRMGERSMWKLEDSKAITTVESLPSWSYVQATRI